MASFVGLFNLDGRQTDHGELRRLAAACRCPAVSTDYWACGGMGLAIRRHDRFMTHGRADNADRLAVDGSVDEPQAFQAIDANSLGSLNGDFAIAACNAASRRLILARDPMGARRLHYAFAGRTLVFATEIKAILAAPALQTGPDMEAITDHVLDRWADPARTCFRGIYSVIPGHLLVVTPDRVHSNAFWEFDTRTRIRCGSLDEYAEAFCAVFDRAVRRRLAPHGSTAVSVSGGLDSSSIYCHAVRAAGTDAGIRVVGINSAYPRQTPADEESFVRSLDRVGPMPLCRVPVAQVDLLTRARDVVASLETPDVVWDVFDAVCAEAVSQGCSVILDGNFGDEVLFPRSYLVDLATRGSWLNAWRHLRAFADGVSDSAGFYRAEFRSALLRSVLPGPILRTFKAATNARRARRYPLCYSRPLIDALVQRHVDRYERRGPSAHHDHYLQWARSGHGLFNIQRQTTAAAMHGLTLGSPFRDRDLIQFLMSVPGEVVTWHGTPKGLLRHAMRGVLPDTIRTRRGKADFTHLVNQDALRQRDRIREVLKPGALVAEYGFVDGAVMTRTVDELLDAIARDTAHDSAISSWHLTGLVALEHWLQHFFGAGSCTTS